MFKNFSPPVTKLGIMSKFGQSNMLGIPALHSVYAKSHPQPLMNDFSMTRKNMANCPGRWRAGQKECSSSVIVSGRMKCQKNYSKPNGWTLLIYWLIFDHRRILPKKILHLKKIYHLMQIR